MATIRTNSGLIDSTASFALSTANNQVTLGDIKTCVTNLSTNALLIGDDLTVAGNFIVHGDTTTLNTNVTATSAFRVDNDGTGPAIVANQTGSQPVIDFQDDDVSVFYIEDGGNIGVGTTNPAYKLDLGGTTASTSNTIRLHQSDGGTAIRIGAGSGGSDVTLLRVDGNSPSDGSSDSAQYGWSLRYKGTGDSNLNTLSIFSDNCAAVSQCEAVTFTQNGSVGIGSNDPAAKLDVAGDACINSVRVGRGRCNVSNNTAVGLNALNYATGACNTGLGHQALVNTTTGCQNTAVGFNSLLSNSTGYVNTAVGTQSMFCNTIGLANTAVGSNSLYSNTTGGYNAALGRGTLFSNISGSCNTAIGFQSLYYNESGCRNVAVGYNSLLSNTTGNFSTAVGHESLNKNTTGCYNTAIGYHSSRCNITSLGNASIGFQSLYYNTSGCYNAAVGMYALHKNTSSGNTAMGYAALICNASSGGNAAFGYTALFCNTGSNNTGLGYQAANANTTGSCNTAVGSNSLFCNTTGCYNTAHGYASLFCNTTGCYNTAHGYASLFSNISGSENTAVGTYSLCSTTTGCYNTAVGYQSLMCNTTGIQNTAVGMHSLYLNTTGVNNTAQGYQSLFSNISGEGNTAVGTESLFSNISGSNNTAVGTYSLCSNTTGINNTAIGRCAGCNITTGSCNTFIGAFTEGGSVSDTNAVAIGYNVNTCGSNTINIGNTSNTKTIFECGNVGIGITAPDAKLQVKAAISTVYANVVPSIANTIISISNIQTSETTNDQAQIQFGVNGGTHNRVGSIGLIAEDATNRKAALVFTTDDAGTRAEKMRITGAGNVGIGTTSPGGKLDVFRVDSSDPGLIARANKDGAKMNFAYTTNHSMGEIGTTYSTASGAMRLWIGGNLNSNSTGHVGPTQQGTSSSSWFSEYNTISDHYQINRIAAGGGTTSSTLFHINSAGYVGIGNTDPGHALQVDGTVSIRPNGSSNDQHYFTTGGVDNAQYIMYNSAGDAVNRFRTDNYSYITGGNVGIGTDNPSDRLTVYGGGINFGTAAITSNTGKLSYNTTSGQLKLSAHSTGGNTCQIFTVSNSGSQIDAVTILNDGDVEIVGAIKTTASSTTSAMVVAYEDQIKKTFTTEYSFTQSGNGVHHFNMAFPQPASSGFRYKAVMIIQRQGSAFSFGSIEDDSYIYWETDEDFTHREEGLVNATIYDAASAYAVTLDDDITSFVSDSVTDTSKTGSSPYGYYIVRYPLNFAHNFSGTNKISVHLETYNYGGGDPVFTIA